MKKILICIVLILFFLMLVSCNTATENETSVIQETQSVEDTDNETIEGESESETQSEFETDTEIDTEINIETETDIPLTASEGLEYTLSADGIAYTVSGIGTCTDKNIVIPSMYNDIPVTAISPKAFYDSDITSVYISKGILIIHNGAFANCASLESVSIPDSVTDIGVDVFDRCNEKLYEIVYGIKYVDNWAIGYDKNAGSSSLILRDGTVGIAMQSFAEGAFVGDVSIPDSVKYIGYKAFYKVKLLGGGCDFVIGNGVENLPIDMLRESTGVSSITIGRNVKTIGDCAFYSCRSIKEIVIPEGVTTVGQSAFFMCDGVETLIIPISVTDIGQFAFQRLSGLSTVYYTGTEEQWKKITVGIGNENLTGTTVNYNYSPE